MIIVAPNHTQWHTHTHTRSIGLLWTRDRPDAETSTWQHAVLTRDRREFSLARIVKISSCLEQIVLRCLWITC